MAGYSRKTALGPGEVLLKADDTLTSIVGLSKTKSSGHGATFSGAEGTVVLSTHRHGMYSQVTAETDQLRTSRMDYEVRKFLNTLPYEPGDAGGPGSGEPAGSR